MNSRRFRALPICAAVLLTGAVGQTALAGESAQLLAVGTIRPSACNIAISDNGHINLGTIPAQSLSQSDATTLATFSFQTTVTCESETLVAVSVADNRAGTAAPLLSLVGGGNDRGFGFGKVDGKAVGTYGLQLQSGLVANGKAAYQLASYTNGEWWGAPGYNAFAGAKYMYSWAEKPAVGQSSVPTPIKTASMPWLVYPIIAAKSKLPDLADDVPLDGSATFTLTYL